MPLVVKGLRSFTGGMPQRLLDNYRKWQMHDLVELLKGLWKELKRHFRSITVISNSLLERLCNRATLSEQEYDNLQQFTDLFTDIKSQATYLPGHGYLNYPNAIQPIT